jgi:hypothetical protein
MAKISINEPGFAGHALLAAVVAMRNDGQKDLFPPGCPVVDVVLTINGQEAPFVPVLEDLWRRYSAEIEKLVVERAEVVASASITSPLADACRQATQLISDAIARESGQSKT